MLNDLPLIQVFTLSHPERQLPWVIDDNGCVRLGEDPSAEPLVIVAERSRRNSPDFQYSLRDIRTGLLLLERDGRLLSVVEEPYDPSVWEIRSIDANVMSLRGYSSEYGPDENGFIVPSLADASRCVWLKKPLTLSSTVQVGYRCDDEAAMDQIYDQVLSKDHEQLDASLIVGTEDCWRHALTVAVLYDRRNVVRHLLRHMLLPQYTDFFSHGAVYHVACRYWNRDMPELTACLDRCQSVLGHDPVLDRYAMLLAVYYCNKDFYRFLLDKTRKAEGHAAAMHLYALELLHRSDDAMEVSGRRLIDFRKRMPELHPLWLHYEDGFRLVSERLDMIRFILSMGPPAGNDLIETIAACPKENDGLLEQLIGLAVNAGVPFEQLVRDGRNMKSSTFQPLYDAYKPSLSEASISPCFDHGILDFNHDRELDLNDIEDYEKTLRFLIGQGFKPSLRSVLFNIHRLQHWPLAEIGNCILEALSLRLLDFFASFLEERERHDVMNRYRPTLTLTTLPKEVLVEIYDCLETKQDCVNFSSVHRNLRFVHFQRHLRPTTLPPFMYPWKQVPLHAKTMSLHGAAKKHKKRNTDRNVCVLTECVSDQSGAAWFNDRFSTRRSFLIEFEFSMSNHHAYMGADGMALVLQNAETKFVPLGSLRGGYLGYDGIPNSVAVELDTFDNNDLFDEPHDHHISVHTRRNLPNSAHHQYSLGCAASDRFAYWRLNSGEPYTLAVHYSHEESFLRVILSNFNHSVSQSVERAGNEQRFLVQVLRDFKLHNVLGGDTFRFGFTAATGGEYQEHTVHQARFYQFDG